VVCGRAALAKIRASIPMTAPDYPYRPHAIEPGVQKYWDDNRCFEVTEDPAR